MQIRVKATGKPYDVLGEQIARDSRGKTRIVGFITAAGVFGPNEVALLVVPGAAEPEGVAVPAVPEGTPPEASQKTRPSRAKKG